jgi:hypothetical protein
MRALLLIVGFAVAPLVLAADSAAGDGVEHDVGGNRFGAGSVVEVTAPVGGDAFLAGGEVTLAAPVEGNAFVTGGHVDVRGPIGKALYAAGGSVTLEGRVGRDAHVAAASIEVARGAELKGKVWLAGRGVTVAGTIDGYLHLAGADVSLNGTVDGDAEIAAEHIEIGPQAHVTGRLRYRSPHEPSVAAGASLAGGLVALPEEQARGYWLGSHRPWRNLDRGVPFGGALVLGVLLLLLAPEFLAEASRIVRGDWPAAVGVGFAVLVGVPIATVLMFITLIGIPAGLLSIALYAATLLVGYVVGAVALGDLALARLAPARADSVLWRMLALLAVLIAFAIVRGVPLIGPLAVFIVFLSGVGALLLRILGHVRGAAPRAA